MPDVVIEVGPIDESLEPEKFEYKMRHQHCGELSQCMAIPGANSCVLHCTVCGLELQVAKEGMVAIWLSSADQHLERDISDWVANPGVRCKVVPVPHI